MSSEHGGGGGLLKSRAENFARHLQTRLCNLKENEDSSWSDLNSSSDTEVYYDINSSLDSPEEEVAEPIFIASKNRATYALERSDSAGSQYFDTVEKPEDLSPGSPVPLKKIPILHLKTDRSSMVTNGHMNLIDADSGCSRVREIPYLKLEEDACETDNAEVSSDSCFPENGNVEFEKSEVNPCVVNSCNAETVEVDTRQTVEDLPIEIAEEVSETMDNSFCVFCDIEQIKSCITSSSPETDASTKGDLTNSHCKMIELKEKSEKLHLELLSTPETNNNSEVVAEIEDAVSLADLLQVLKKEISKEDQQDTTKPAMVDDCDSVFPIIEVRESSPSVVDAKVKDDEEEYDIETKRKNFRRCSSLKSGKTPPGTPGRKKIVRFADVLGLDLADVKTFLDEVPTVPKSAFEDLHGIEMSSSPVTESPIATVTVVTPQPEKILVILFQQPSVQPNFLDRVRENNVCLENAFVSDTSLFAISGFVRVKNIDFHKSVYIRYSIDNWRSFSDLQARYVPDSCDGFSDKFAFMLYAHTLNVGQRLEFAVRFHAAGAQFWDSNGGVNYAFECTTHGPPRTYVDPNIPASPVETWASFY
ncbi:hypothetical protein J6590_060260 [Homalodisca vitripennis]|nr:hypothetical protein J6590_060260 [Homalodisca vitripennis]